MSRKIIFYDGICPFCNFWVNKILKWDKEETFLFASLQGETAELFFKENSILVIPNSLIYWEENKSYALRSLAVFEIAKHLKGFVGLIVIFRFYQLFLQMGFTHLLQTIVFYLVNLLMLVLCPHWIYGIDF